MNRQDFYMGNSFDAHEYFGAHANEESTVFRTFAPNASRITLLSSFNGWQEVPMDKIDGGGFYEVTINKNLDGEMYKYRIYHHNTFTDHSDPYGYGTELRPNTASIVRDLTKYTFADSEWNDSSGSDRFENKAMNIYELHLGSWKKKGSNQTDWYNYEEIAELLIPYLKENGYNCVEMLPLSEHPMDCSWGYQNTGFFSPTARYGTATQLMKLIDKLHEAGISAFIDFVPVHFAVDNYALANFDGTPLYEYPNDAVGVSEWGSCNFMHSRGEVRSFLQSCANYWLEYYHFDGIRMDAISNMIYWQGDSNRGVNNLAVDFLKNMNRNLHKLHPHACLMAEDSTNYGNVTKSADNGGLEFDYKWDMGWMNDTLDYFKHSPSERSDIYHKLTFSMMYYYNEHFLLPLSHDEVVHGKGTIVNKMFGNEQDKYRQARALYMYMYLHPGKKLNFMGNETGQLREWNEDVEQDLSPEAGSLMDDFNSFMKKLNNLYLNTPSLYELDYEEDGFEWIDCHQESRCIYVIKRTSKSGKSVIGLFNFSDKDEDYILNLENDCELMLLLDSNNIDDNKKIKVTGKSATIRLEHYSGLIYSVN